MSQGIYTLANDAVADQLVALLNSIEINAGADFPVCVIAYDDRLDRVRREIADRPQVMLLADPAIFRPWEDFSRRIWQQHPIALSQWRSKGTADVYRLGSNRRYVAFDAAAPFDRFLYLDADTLLLDAPTVFFQIDRGFVVYDFQFKDPAHIFNLQSHQLDQCFSEQQQQQIFCAGCFAARRGLFSIEQRDRLIELAAEEANVLYPSAPNQSLLNYMTLRSNISVYNLAIHLPQSIRTGNSITSTHFEQRGLHLFDRDRKLTYLHYIGLPAAPFAQVCRGENIEFPYRDLFLDYRYFNQPHSRPIFRSPPRSYQARSPLLKRISRKLGLKQ